MALEEAFSGLGKLKPFPPDILFMVRTSSMALGQDTHSLNHHAITHSPAWTRLASRAKVTEPHRPGTANILHWNLLSMAVAQIEPILKPYDTYLPPLNSRHLQDNLSVVQA